MSLFPAYALEKDGEVDNARCTVNETEQTGPIEDPFRTNWLLNPSFHKQSTPEESVENEQHQLLSDDSALSVPDIGASDVVTDCRVVKRKKHEAHREKKHIHKDLEKKRKYEESVPNVYTEDRFRDKRYNSVDTLSSTARPRYIPSTKHLGFMAFRKLKKTSFQRYHSKNIDVVEKEKKKNPVITRESIRRDTEENEKYDWCRNLEEEGKQKIKEYNERLGQNPHDIETWLSYVGFQDILMKFQKAKPVKDTGRTTTQKKLSIVEKALEKNSSSLPLLKLKLRFMGELLPGDDMTLELEKMLSKDPSNVVLWQALIMVTQGSLALCTVHKVLQLYSRFFSSMKHSSRTNPRAHDDRLLTMLHRCLIFMRQAGLWEHMWETISLNVCLNFNVNKDRLCFQKVVEEKKVIEMEEVILMSKLPLNQLWLRTELLREHCNWIGVNKDHLELIGDSRRFVLAEDVADYVHPLIMRGSNFRMAVYFLLTMKIPLLPSRSCAFTILGLEDLEWTIDSAEMLLPFAYPAVGETYGQNRGRLLLDGILDGGITSGPQYLKFHPAQETYLDFLRNTFQAIADGLDAAERTSIYVWWLRFERLLIFLNKDEHPRLDPKGKKLKATLKEFLKREENRSNLHFYREYALIEREMGRLESCLNILETAIHSQDTSSILAMDRDSCAALFSLYRTLIEVLLDAEISTDSRKCRIRKAFEEIIPGESLPAVEEYLRNRVDHFLQAKPMQENDEETIVFLPDEDCDTIICYAYFLYVIDREIGEVLSVLNACIDHSKECRHLQEMLYESELSLLQLYERRSGEAHRLSREVLQSALGLYPDNIYALSIYCDVESERPFWKFNGRQPDLGLWQAIATCLILRRKTRVLLRDGSSDAAKAALNKTLSFHRMLAKHPRIKSCPLLWRLYMLLLREHNLCESIGEEVYHQSVAECPWARGIYIDTAAVAPQLLTQIQDVIREKELRMHVTPEELDILRG